MSEVIRECSSCLQVLGIENFGIGKANRGGRRPRCLDCERAAYVKHRIEKGLRVRLTPPQTPEQRREKSKQRLREARKRKAEAEGRPLRKWGYLKPEERRAHSIEWKRQSRRKKAAEQGRVLVLPRTLHQAHVNAWKLYLKRENHQYIRSRRIGLHDAHVVTWKSDGARLQKWKYNHRPERMLYHRLKRWMHKHLGNALPSRKWSQHLGYTVDELRAHIERQFVKGMGWHNKGEWHIDHIVPVSAFDADSVEHPDFKACFGLPNLRPMWGKDNIRKGAKRVSLRSDRRAVVVDHGASHVTLMPE